MMDKYVLCYGDDPELLRIRRLVLEQAGLKVLATTEAEALRQMAKLQQVSLLIVGHSLGEKECKRALHLARDCNPPIKALMLYIYSPACDVEVDVETLDALDGPQRLIEKVKKILSEMASGEPVESPLPKGSPASGQSTSLPT
jgi:CheY-like chemotaxis protein